jgi:RHS repeat-associated protein
LLYEVGSGGANSTGSSHYVYLPTPAGPMPIATYTGNKHYAVQTDHLNTPRRLINSSKQVAWQWAFSAFGDEQPTLARNRFVDPSITPNAGTTTIAEVTFNLRYPGQYFDKESGLSYNLMRSYSPTTGRYTQADPIDLQGGWNKYGYAYQNSLMYTDPTGEIVQAAAAFCFTNPIGLLVCAGGVTAASTQTGQKVIKDIAQKIQDLCKPDDKDNCEIQLEEDESLCFNNYGRIFGFANFSFQGCMQNARTRFQQCKRGQPQIPRWSDGHVTGEPPISPRTK